MTNDPQLDAFVAFSAVATGFSEFDVWATGQAESFRATVADEAGADVLADLLAAHAAVRDAAGEDPEATGRLLRRDVFSDPRLGPVARNVIKLWYVGIWYELPPEWTKAYGVAGRSRMFTVSAAAYTEGLLWPAIGANPPGVRGPGYASWVGPPRIPEPPAGAP